MNLYSFFIKNFNPQKKLIFDKKIYFYKDFLFLIDNVSNYLSGFNNKRKILHLTDNL